MRSFATLLCVFFSFVSISSGCGLNKACCPITQIPYATCEEGDFTSQRRCPPDNSLKIVTGKGDDTCLCKPGFVWRDEDTCVPLEDCCSGNRTVNVLPTCEDQCSTYPPVSECSKQDNRCVCKKGYVLNYDNQCILPVDCEKCGPNEYYYRCLNDCERTCVNKSDSVFCPDICKGPGCACKPGHVRNVEGQCIPAEQCPSCGENEVYIANPPACEETCDGPILECSKICLSQGCACLPNYVRDAFGKCIPKKDCPVCGQNEIFSTCPIACEKTCLNKDIKISCIDPPCLAPACVCKNGFVKDVNGVCIPVGECPTCAKNERLVANPDVCPKSCDVNDKSCIFRTPALQQGCECIPGYVRDVNRNCIPLEDCPKCGDHEVYDIFHPEATVECDDDKIDRNYLKSGCVCEEGYTRNSAGFCVPNNESDVPSVEDDDDDEEDDSPEDDKDNGNCGTCENGGRKRPECKRGYTRVGDFCVKYVNKKYEHGRCFTKHTRKLRNFRGKGKFFR